MSGPTDISRRTAIVWLTAATALGGAFRFYGLAWGAPYYHFHIDEHFVFAFADGIAQGAREASDMAKFFIYSPFPMYVLNAIRAAYEAVSHPLDLTVPADEITYMVMGRAISAAFGTATIPLAYLAARRISTRLGGVFAAVLLACAVAHLRESHFFSVDVTMTFFTMLTLVFALRIVDRGSIGAEAGAAVGLGLAVCSKYTGAFVGPLIAIAEVLSPRAPRTLVPFQTAAWWRIVLRTALVGAAGVALFLAFDWMVIVNFEKFQSDIKTIITDPLSGASKPEWIAQFADVNAFPYWFTNLLFWGLGPALEIAGLSGLVWLLAVRRDRASIVVAAFTLLYWILAGRTASYAPFARYAVPLAPPFAILAGAAFAHGLLASAWRKAAMAAAGVVIGATACWAVAYMNVYHQPDSRLAAAAWIRQNIPEGARVLVEPSHNIPPMGSYRTDVSFHRDYVLWGPPRTPEQKTDYYQLAVIDMYRSLYNSEPTDDWRRGYIESRLALADWIVMDDTFLQQYGHLPEPEFGVVKQYYRDLFGGRLGFKLVKTFKVYPRLFGVDINDDAAELTFRSFDHPRVFVFLRQ